MTSDIIPKKEFARRMKLTLGRITQLIGAGLPTSNGRIPFTEAKKWYHDNITQGMLKRGPADDAQPARQRLIQSQIEKNQMATLIRGLEYKKRQGELLEKFQVKEEWGRLLTTFRNRMLYVPSRISQKIASITDDRERRAIIEREIKEALTTLSNYDPEGKQ